MSAHGPHGTLARDLDRTGVRITALTYALLGSQTSDFFNDRALARTRALALTRVLILALARVIVSDPRLVRILVQDLFRVVVLVIVLVLDGLHFRDLARRRRLLVRRIRHLGFDLKKELRSRTYQAGQAPPGEVKRVAFWAASLLNAAVRLLPAADRARYAEEYRSELDELTRAGAKRWPQLRYAFGQLRSAPQMRFALRVARRGSAAQ